MTKNINKKQLAERIWKKWEIIYTKLEWNIIDEVLKYTKNSTIEVEDNITLKYFEAIGKKHSGKIKIQVPFFEEKRMIKQSDERKNIKKAIQIIDNVWREIEKLSNSEKIIWKTEAEVRTIIVTKILELWWAWESFEAIVAFWKNSAIPHHKASDTIIWNGALLIDMWALYKWYCSDFTRTIWVWDKTEDYKEFQKIYTSVAKAHKKACIFAKPWVKGKEIDSVTRKSIEKDWYWEFFTHSTGHWVGINIHEQPWINKKSTQIIEENMVFTIEPGIYLQWKFWVRLENIVFVQKNWVKCSSEIKL